MKNKVFFILLAVVLALSVGLVGCPPPPPQPPDAIVIGLARDIVGPLSFFECYGAGPVYRWFATHVNEDVGQAGKIHLSAYDTATTQCWVPIELEVRGFAVAAWDMADVTQGLIDDGADFIWGGPGTDCIYTQAPVCNAMSTLLITLEGGASEMIWEHEGYLDNWPYVWVSQSFANRYQIPVVWQMLKDHVATPKAYITYIGGMGTEDGIEYRDETKLVFNASNVIDGNFHSYNLSANPGEADAIIQNAKVALNETPYDIFCAFTYPWNVATLIQACINNNFNPPAILFGLGANFASYCNVYFGSNMDGMLCFATANDKTVPKVGTPTMSMATMYNSFAAQIEDDWLHVTWCPQGPGFTKGQDQLDFWGMPCYMAALEMWKEAVEKAGELDALTVRAALLSFNSTNPAQTVFGDTWYEVFGGGYGGGVMDHMCHTGEIGQWQDSYCEIVGYSNINTVPNTSPDPSAPLVNYDATASFIWPMTNHWFWIAGVPYP